MTPISNFHTHCYFCDGEKDPEEYVKKAISLKYKVFGFSSHAPLPFETSWALKSDKLIEYCDTINKLKNKYKDFLEIYLGLEIDYLPEVLGPSSDVIKSLNLDFTIGSVHLIKDEINKEYLCIDDEPEEFETLLNRVFSGNIYKLVSKYYSLLGEMVEKDKPNIVGHFDIIKKNNKGNRYFNEDEKWYKDIVIEALEKISFSECIMEVNTGGIARGYTDVPYPSLFILKEAKKLNIPIMLNADAHTPQDLTVYFNEALSLIKEAGYSTQRILINGKWTDVNL